MIRTLKILNLGKSYQGKRVVRDVNFEIRCGEIVGLLGPNGAGKTTLFYMLTGLIYPDHGKIYLDEIDITNIPMYKRSRSGITYLPQEPSIFRGMNVELNITAILELYEKDKIARQNKLEELLAEFSITHLRKVPATALSGGERRRVEIARALAANPHFLLLDEPLAGIDPMAVDEIKELILHLKNRNMGILITDHNVREVLSIVDEAYIMHSGSILTHGTPKQIIHNKQVKSIYLGENF
jgi:lipopolysaccharide export system ATP-binding protein